MGEEEIWDLTPAQFYAILERFKIQYERSLHGSALVCSTVANLHRDPKKQIKPFSPLDFLPSKQQREVQSIEEQKRIVIAINAALGGSDERR